MTDDDRPVRGSARPPLIDTWRIGPRFGPQRVPLRALLAVTGIGFGFFLIPQYLGGRGGPDGPSPLIALEVAAPALLFFLIQQVRNGRQALLLAWLAGLAACAALACLLGADQDWADYTGVAVGTVVCDLVFWALTRRHRKPRVRATGGD